MAGGILFFESIVCISNFGLFVLSIISIVNSGTFACSCCASCCGPTSSCCGSCCGDCCCDDVVAVNNTVAPVGPGVVYVNQAQPYPQQQTQPYPQQPIPMNQNVQYIVPTTGVPQYPYSQPVSTV